MYMCWWGRDLAELSRKLCVLLLDNFCRYYWKNSWILKEEEKYYWVSSKVCWAPTVCEEVGQALDGRAPAAAAAAGDLSGWALLLSISLMPFRVPHSELDLILSSFYIFNPALSHPQMCPSLCQAWWQTSVFLVAGVDLASRALWWLARFLVISADHVTSSWTSFWHCARPSAQPQLLNRLVQPAEEHAYSLQRPLILLLSECSISSPPPSVTVLVSGGCIARGWLLRGLSWMPASGLHAAHRVPSRPLSYLSDWRDLLAFSDRCRLGPRAS